MKKEVKKQKVRRFPGRPQTKIDLDQFEKLAQLHCTLDEAAAFFRCAKNTIMRYLRKTEFRDAWDRGRSYGKMSLRRLQWQHANEKGSSAVQMTIHLSKHWLGETEKAAVELTGTNGGPIETKDVSPRELIASRIAGIAARSREGGDTCGADGRTS